MASRALGVLAAAAAACVLAASSVAWACVTAEGPLVHELFTQRAPVGHELTVSGEAWSPSNPVQVAWAASTSEPSQPLASAVPDSAGAFSAEIRVPDAPAGFYYVIVSQDATVRATPFELVAPANAETAAATRQGSGQLWNGLRAGSSSQGLADVAAKPSSEAHLPVRLLIGGSLLVGLAVLGVLVLAETRRTVRVRTED